MFLYLTTGLLSEGAQAAVIIVWSAKLLPSDDILAPGSIFDRLGGNRTISRPAFEFTNKGFNASLATCLRVH